MTKLEFKELTGENPEDVLGGDWENIIEDYKEDKGGEIKWRYQL